MGLREEKVFNSQFSSLCMWRYIQRYARKQILSLNTNNKLKILYKSMIQDEDF